MAALQYASQLWQQEGLICENALCGSLEEAKALAKAKAIPRVDVVGENGIVKGGAAK